jgi:hypothetical protein
MNLINSLPAFFLIMRVCAGLCDLACLTIHKSYVVILKYIFLWVDATNRGLWYLLDYVKVLFFCRGHVCGERHKQRWMETRELTCVYMKVY